jgi:hypothetical protein
LRDAGHSLSGAHESGFEEEGDNHYSLLRTIERNSASGHQSKNDDGANWFQQLWHRGFE